jgi:hypothetical protein
LFEGRVFGMMSKFSREKREKRENRENRERERENPYRTEPPPNPCPENEKLMLIIISNTRI